jgi:hypothetical protein
VPGGTGAKSGLIFVGDVLRFVGVVDVTKTVGPDFENLLVGDDGSTVTLSFDKPGSNTSALMHVSVIRGPDPVSQESSSRESTSSSTITSVGTTFISPPPPVILANIRHCVCVL